MYHHQILTLPILQVSLHPTSSELADLCAALEEHSAGPMQGVFEQRMTAAGAYCFTSGKAVYNSVRLDGAMELSPGDWASEAPRPWIAGGRSVGRPVAPSTHPIVDRRWLRC